MNRIRTNAYALSLHAAAMLILLYVLTQGNTIYADTGAFHTGLESGKWAMRFLLLCLAMTPLSTYFRWTGAIRLRKPAGLWAFGFSVVHVYYYLDEAGLAWLDPALPLYLALGLYGLGVFAALAATSNRWSMRRLGKNWKRLHRLIYSAGIAVAVHALFAAAYSKKMGIFDPQAIPELRAYLALLVVLLAVRVPRVRALLKALMPPRTVSAPRPAEMKANGHSRIQPHWTPELPIERELPTPVVELWRSPNGSFVWSAAREGEVGLRGILEEQPDGEGFEDEVVSAPTH